MKILAAVATIIIISACSDVSSTMCYDRYLGYDDVCDANSQYYSESLCTQWKKEAFDENRAQYNKKYTVGPVEDCIENVHFK